MASNTPQNVAHIPQAVPRLGGRVIAETSGQPTGLTQRVLLNVFEAFFRRPFMHLIPLGLLVALGVFSAMGSPKEYQSVGILNASSGTLLSELTGNVPSFGFERSSEVTSRNINDLLGTGRFLTQVIEAAGLTGAVESGALTRDEIRQSISAGPNGDTLVAVAATTPQPEQSQRLATATLDSFVEYIVTNDIADAMVRVETYKSLRDDDLEAFQVAQQNLDAYLLEHPWTGDEDLRPIAEQLAIARLQDNVTRADNTLTASEDNVDEAQLAADVARTVVTRQLRIIDEPEMPFSPLTGLKAAVTTVGIFVVLGTFLSLAFVVLTAVLDRTIRIPNDVSTKFGLEVLAVVPSARR